MIVKLAVTHLTLKELKENRVELTKSELDEIFKRKAVWHHGPNGEETPAVWKAHDFSNPKKVIDGKLSYIYVTNTHRAMNTAPTLSGVISRFHKFIKGTA